MIGEDKFIKFTGCKSNKSCTIVLRGSSKHILDEAERSFHDAICVLVNTIKNKKVLYGGGNSEMRMASAVDKLAKTVKGKTANGETEAPAAKKETVISNLNKVAKLESVII